MPIHKRFTIKDLEQVQPGELIAFDFGGRTLGIAMARNDSELLMQVLVLKSAPNGPHPHWVTVRMTDTAISFGSDWVLDLNHDEAYPGNHARMEHPGSVLVSQSGVVMRAAGDGATSQSRGAYFDMTRFRQNTNVPISSSSVCIRDWKVWLDETERTRDGGEPIASFRDTGS